VGAIVLAPARGDTSDAQRSSYLGVRPRAFRAGVVCSTDLLADVSLEFLAAHRPWHAHCRGRGSLGVLLSAASA
jgi:hypothetical protein